MLYNPTRRLVFPRKNFMGAAIDTVLAEYERRYPLSFEFGDGGIKARFSTQGPVLDFRVIKLGTGESDKVKATSIYNHEFLFPIHFVSNDLLLDAKSSLDLVLQTQSGRNLMAARLGKDLPYYVPFEITDIGVNESGREDWVTSRVITNNVPDSYQVIGSVIVPYKR